MKITRRLWDKANELNDKEDAEHNGKAYNTKEGKFLVLSGEIRFIKNKPQ